MLTRVLTRTFSRTFHDREHLRANRRMPKEPPPGAKRKIAAARRALFNRSRQRGDRHTIEQVSTRRSTEPAHRRRLVAMAGALLQILPASNPFAGASVQEGRLNPREPEVS